MSTGFSSVIDHFDRNGLVYRSDADLEVISAGFSGKAGAYQILVKVDDQDNLVQVFGTVPLAVPEGSRNDICQTLTRANYGLRVGRFEFDLDDGQIHFHVTNVMDGHELSDKLVGRLIGTTLAMLDRYMPAILGVIYGNELPVDAIRRVEQ